MLPLVSVVLPVFNAENTLKKSIESILNQDFKDFELIILLDGSTDASKEIALSNSDPRIRVIESPNIGLVEILNLGIKHSRGKYVARQDADDISIRSRLGTQVVYMEAQPDLGMIGTWAEIFSDKSKDIEYHRHPVSPCALSLFLLFDNPFVHSSVMIKKSLLMEVGLYKEEFSNNPPEDYDLWISIENLSKVANIPKILIKYRDSPLGISKKNKELIKKNILKISSKNLHNKFQDYLTLIQCQKLSLLYHNPEIKNFGIGELWMIQKFIWLIYKKRLIKNKESALIAFKIIKKMIKNFIYNVIKG